MDEEIIREEDASAYRVKLEVFEGPLDLLLYLIRKHEIDIYDIPIALITEQYMEYLGVMREMNLDVAGEFLVMASTLAYIKSRMLLPKPPVEEQIEGDEDPREELVRRLLEYKRYKEAADQLENFERLGRDVFRSTRADGLDDREDREISIEDVTLFHLIDAFKDVVVEFSKRQDYETIEGETISIADRIVEIMEVLEGESMVTFDALFEKGASKNVLIVTFLAILEMIKRMIIRASQAQAMGPIRIYLSIVKDGNEDESTGSDNGE